MAISKQKHVLVTGASGGIGRPVCRELIARGHKVRAFDRREPVFPIDGLHEMRLGDLTHRDDVEGAVQGVDAIVHLAAFPDEADFMTVLLQPNVYGLYYLLEAAHKANTPRVVLTSSTQVVEGLDIQNRMIRLDESPSPRTHYGVTKYLCEAWGRYYAGQQGMSIIVVRPGGLPRDQGQVDVVKANKFFQRLYLSPGDAGRAFADCVDAQNISFALIAVTSKSADCELVDLGPAKELVGFEPQDTWPDDVQTVLTS